MRFTTLKAKRFFPKREGAKKKSCIAILLLKLEDGRGWTDPYFSPKGNSPFVKAECHQLSGVQNVHYLIRLSVF